jgi:ATP-dependent Lon protease
VKFFSSSEKNVDHDTHDLEKAIDESMQLNREVTALYNLLANIYGTDRLVFKAGKLNALDGMKSESVAERVLALQKIVFEDPTLDKIPAENEISEILLDIEEEISDLLARKAVEDRLEKRISDRMQTRHEEYLKDIKLQILKEEGGPENAQTQAKDEQLDRLEQRKLTKSLLEFVRPSSLKEVVGQDAAVKSMLAKIASPYPQHVLLYGPPGVGKTTVARLALQEARKLPYSPFSVDAPFVEVDGATLRWDPREVTNPLLGSVHDPIYQGARKDLADGGVPEPKLGLVSEANGGVLFIDEIGELDYILQTKLLKVLEDKRVQFDSSYYDPDEPNVPSYIRRIFENGVPADFILIGATTKDPDEINPAIRSRCSEVYFEPLTPEHIINIVENAAEKLGVELDSHVAEMISEYTIEGRKAVSILADAYGYSLYKRNEQISSDCINAKLTKDDLTDVLRTSRLVPYSGNKARDVKEIGKIFGLGVMGYLGSVIEIEAVAFLSKEPGKGSVRFNDTAGSMTRDSMFNAASLMRRITGEDITNYDIHVNVIGGGNIDGPSAGTAIFLAVYSAVKNIPIPQDIAVSGEVSLQGKIKSVGGLAQKLYGARQAGMKKVYIPGENKREIPDAIKGMDVLAIDQIEDLIAQLFDQGNR